MTNEAGTEFDRFLVLFDHLVEITNDWIARTPEDKLDWVPVDNKNVRFGDRVSLVTIKSLYIHTAVGEHHWIRNLRDCADGAVLPVPKDPDLSAQLSAGDFVARCGNMHRENMQILRDFDERQLKKSVSFVDRQWTVMGFLWAIQAHRAYHLGNIDIYLRQSDTAAPDFFHFHATEMA